MRRIGLTFCLTSLLALQPQLAQAQMYKWVDANGQTQYSDRPPPDGVKADKITKTGAAAAAPAPAPKGGPPTTAASRELEFRKRQLAQEEKLKDAQQKEKDDAAKQENCDIARARLKSLEDGGRILKYDKAGEREYLSSEEIDKEKGPARARVDEACKK
jgi:Domain of unknown function (DUF4124)